MKIRTIRTKLGLTQSELAQILGLSSKSRIAEYENGTRNPSASVKLLLMLLDKGIISVKLLKSLST